MTAFGAIREIMEWESIEKAIDYLLNLYHITLLLQLFFYFCFRLCTIFTWSVCAVLNDTVSNECVSCDVVVLAQQGSLFCNRACLSFQAFTLCDFKCQSEKAAA